MLVWSVLAILCSLYCLSQASVTRIMRAVIYGGVVLKIFDSGSDLTFFVKNTVDILAFLSWLRSDTQKVGNLGTKFPNISNKAFVGLGSWSVQLVRQAGPSS